MNLSSFTSDNLFAATTGFFGQLGIKLNSNTAQSLDAQTILGEQYKGRPPFANIRELYFAGLIDDSIFQKDRLFDNGITFEEAQLKTYKSLMVFTLKLDTQPTRTEISELVRAFNRKRETTNTPPVALLLSYENKISLALSELAFYKQAWRPGQKVGKIIILRDISIENTHAGHLRILQDLANHKANNFNELHEAWLHVLDVNILNKRFFQELSNWYFWAMRNVQFPADKEPDEETRNATNLIRLITRIIFIWFIKEKGLVPENLFDKNFLKTILRHSALDAESHDYYNAILQNLFFGTLNQKIEERKFTENTGRNGLQISEYGVKNIYRYADLFSIPEKEVIDLFKDVPFLNGGLFDCLDKENEDKKVEYVDGFSRNPKKQAIVPDFLFFGKEKDVDLNSIYDTKGKTYKVKGLIHLLNSYKFTIAENTPQEEDVALDPELLGKVFENLLANYNPETKTTARKQTGSFYTPREIVNYMVDESLVAYLMEHTKEKELHPKVVEGDSVVVDSSCFETRLRDVLSYSENTNPFNENETKRLIEVINNCKILDPACGSGAFPMGVLHRMVNILQKLDPENHEWRRLQEEKACREANDAFKIINQQEREERLKEISDIFENNASDYGRKLYLIENCIFGVDIQPIAVQIAKLRFFISLIIDQKTDTNKDNFGIRALPNLETKFVAANTLIGLEKPKQGNLFRTLEIVSKENEIKQVRHEYFTANNRSKKLKLQDKDKRLRKELAEELAKMEYSRSEAEKIATLDLFDQNAFAQWFEPEWMFGFNESECFDIVIGNPPYVQLQNNSGELAKRYENCKYKTFARTGDLYSLFYERGWQLLKPQGRLCFITSNKWMRAGYGESTRKFFAENTNPEQLIDFAGIKVFESATVDVNILMFAKDKNRQQTKACVVKKDSIKDLSVFIRQSSSVCSFGSDSWVVLSPIEQRIKAKIEAVGTPLKDWDIKINYGIKTGFNDAFIISGAKRKELIEQDPKSVEIIRPLLRGRDIKRYGYVFADLYLITTFPSLKIDIDMYPAVKQHLLSFGYDRLKQTGEPGARKKTNNQWFETQDPISYWDDFYRQKIVYIEIMTDNPDEGYEFPSFSFDTQGCTLLNTAYMMSGSENELKVILSILNSALGKQLVKFYVTQLQLRQFRMLHQDVIKFPIPKLSSIEREPLIKSVEEILSSKRKGLDTRKLEITLNNLVSDLYRLSQEEKEAIGFIESQ